MAKKVKCITNRDKELIKQLGRTGVITQNQICDYLGYSPDNKRVNNLVRSGFLEKNVTKFGKGYITFYKLDRGGREYAKDTLGMSYLYKSASAPHDQKLTELYYTKFFDYRETWHTETYYKFNQGHTSGIVDATVEIDGQTVAIEITTNNYTEEQIQEKIENATANGWKIELYQAQ